MGNRLFYPLNGDNICQVQSSICLIANSVVPNLQSTLNRVESWYRLLTVLAWAYYRLIKELCKEQIQRWRYKPEKDWCGGNIYLSFHSPESAPSYVSAKHWIADFKQDRTSNEDEPRVRRPKTATTPDIIHEELNIG